jgi:transcriptional regulator with XRE-family HTH domain
MDACELVIRFGNRVRMLRRSRDVTQAQLAEAIERSTEFVSRIERGIASPSFPTVAAIAEALAVEPKDLFDFSALPASTRKGR